MSPVNGKALISDEREFSYDLQVVVCQVFIKTEFLGKRST